MYFCFCCYVLLAASWDWHSVDIVREFCETFAKAPQPASLLDGMAHNRSGALEYPIGATKI
jgi:hypothetical protein